MLTEEQTKSYKKQLRAIKQSLMEEVVPTWDEILDRLGMNFPGTDKEVIDEMLNLPDDVLEKLAKEIT